MSDENAGEETDGQKEGLLERFLNLFAEVRSGEGPVVLLLFANLFLLLVGYYVIKTAREALVLVGGGAEVKSYAAAGQALLLIGLVPLYSWLASRVSRFKLIVVVTCAFIVAMQGFALWSVITPPEAEQGRVASSESPPPDLRPGAVAGGVVGAADLATVRTAPTAVSGARALEDDDSALPVDDGGETDDTQASASDRDDGDDDEDFPWHALYGLGFVFYVFVGIFSVSIIAQLWSYANDVYTQKAGDRLFPIVAVGATAGAPLGSQIGQLLGEFELPPIWSIEIGALLLALSLGIYFWIERRLEQSDVDSHATLDAEQSESAPSEDSRNGFALIFGRKYLLLIAAVLMVLNIVNTTGEYILGSLVVDAAETAVQAGEAGSKGAWIQAYYGEFFKIVNIVAFFIQALLVSRIVKYLGMKAMIFLLPVIALGVYGLMATGLIGIAVFRWLKTAENSTDYSVMNSTKAMLWLVVTREEKYAGKQTADTFFVRFGDVLSAVLVFVGTTVFELTVHGFAAFNVGVIFVWLVLSALLLKFYREEREAYEERHGVSPEEEVAT